MAILSLWLLRKKSDRDRLDSASSRKPHSTANFAKHPRYHNAFIGSAGVSEEIHEPALSKLRHGGSEDCHTEARSHVPRSIISSDTWCGYDPQFGARPLKRAIQEHLLDPLATKLLAGKFKPNDKIRVSAKDGELTFGKK